MAEVQTSQASLLVGIFMLNIIITVGLWLACSLHAEDVWLM